MLNALGKKPKEDDELEESGATANSDFSNFTYNFKDNLKIKPKNDPESDEDLKQIEEVRREELAKTIKEAPSTPEKSPTK